MPGPVFMPPHAQAAASGRGPQHPGAPAAQSSGPASLPHQPHAAVPGPHCQRMPVPFPLQPPIMWDASKAVSSCMLHKGMQRCAQVVCGYQV